MRDRSDIRWLWLAVLAMPLLSGAGNIEGEKNSAPGLVLGAAAAQEVFAVGEPVVIDLKLTNVSSTEVSLFGDLSANTGTIRFEIAGPSRNVQKYVPRDMRDPSSRVKLQPGDALAAIQDISLLRQRWPDGELMFPVPGQYRVTVNYDGFLPADVPRPQPATVEIVIRDSGGGRALEVFRDPLVRRFIAGEGPDPAAAEKLRSLLHEASPGIFEPYIVYFLGEDCLTTSEQVSPPANQAELKRCAGLLTRAANHDFQLRDMALLGLARIEIALDSLNLARKHAGMSRDTSRRLYVQKRAARLLETIGQKQQGKKG